MQALLHAVPVEHILGKLSLVQAGDTGTIPFEDLRLAQNQEDHDEFRDEYYPGGRADSAPGRGDRTRRWHTNVWALRWSRDM